MTKNKAYRILSTGELLNTQIADLYTVKQMQLILRWIWTGNIWTR